MLLMWLIFHVMLIQGKLYAAAYEEEFDIPSSDLSNDAIEFAKRQNQPSTIGRPGNDTDCKQITIFDCSWGVASPFATPQCGRQISLSYVYGETDCLVGREVDELFEIGDFNKGANCAEVDSVRKEPLCTRDSGNVCALKSLTTKKRSKDWFDPLLGLDEDFIEKDLNQCLNSKPKACADELCDFLDCSLSNSLTCGNLALIKYCKSQSDKKEAFLKKCKGTPNIPNECYALHYEKGQTYIDSQTFEVSGGVLKPRYNSIDFKELCANMKIREKCSAWLKTTFGENHYKLCGEVDPDATTSALLTTATTTTPFSSTDEPTSESLTTTTTTTATSNIISSRRRSEPSTSEATTAKEVVDGEGSDTTENGRIEMGGRSGIITSTKPTSVIPCEMLCGNVNDVSKCVEAIIKDAAVRVRCEREAMTFYEKACTDKTDDENCEKLGSALVSNGGTKKKFSDSSRVIIIVAVILVLVLIAIIAALLLVKTHRNRKRKKSLVNHGEGVKKTSSKTIGLATDMDIKSVASLATPATAKNKNVSTTSRVDRDTTKTGKNQLKTVTQATSSRADGKTKQGKTSKQGSSKTGSTPKQGSKASQKSQKSAKSGKK